MVDLGLPAEEVAELVTIGDLITLDVPMIELQNGRLAAKTMDDRACVAAVTACLHYLHGMQHRWDVYATATMQEETGLKGATTAAYRIQPDIGIALDVGFAAAVRRGSGRRAWRWAAGRELASGRIFIPA